MLTAVVTKSGALVNVDLVTVDLDEVDPAICEFTETNDAGVEVCTEGPSPIAPEAKEIAWGAGSFIVLALLMRFVLFPRLKQGMDARYSLIRDGHEQADTARASARAEVAEYESALANVKAEANERVDAARQTLEAERTDRLAEANAAANAQREAAAAQAREAREAAQADVSAAVVDVTSRTVELALGRAPDPALVRSAVDDVMGAGVAS